jgi:4-amino-4-deoxy-L-arabinose transferase-like glycosyltransferase
MTELKQQDESSAGPAADAAPDAAADGTSTDVGADASTDTAADTPTDTAAADAATDAAADGTERAHPGSQPTADWRTLWPLVVILAAYAVLALAYNLATPVGESPDEPTHIEYVLYLRNERKLPVLPIEEEGLAQAKHPPLYYLAAAAVSSWADMSTLGFVPNPHFTFNMEAPSSSAAFLHFPFSRFPYTDAEGFLAVRIMRLLSLLCGAIVVAATYFLGRTTWPDRGYLQWGPAAFVAFLPGFLFISGVVNNDTMANAFAALVLLISVRVALGHASRRNLVLLGLALGLGLLTKLTIIAAAGIAALGVLAHAYRRRDPAFLARAAVYAGIPVVVTFGLWIVRNVITYGPSDPLGWARWQAKIPQMARQIPLSAEIEAYFWIQLTTFWARFGWATISLPDTVYHVLLGVLALAAVGLLVLLLRDCRKLSADTRWSLALISVSVALLYLSVFRLAFTFNLVVAHGRYLYIALAGLAVLFVTGLTRLLPRRVRPAATLAFSCALLALSVVSLTRYIVPAFAPPEPLTQSEVAAIDTPVGIDFGGKLRLEGYDLSSKRIGAGEPLTATLYWSATEGNWEPFPPEPSGHIAFVHAIDASGEVVGRVDDAPFGGNHPTGVWVPGQVWRQDYSMEISRDAVPGKAALHVGWHVVEQPDERLEASVGGEPLGDTYSIEPLVIRPTTHVEYDPSRAPERRDTFGRAGEITLVGARAELDEKALDVTLIWRAEHPLPDDYTVFVHLVGPEGELVATGDSQPQSGRYPTSLWEPGETVLDNHRFDVPAGLPPGPYQVLVGLYDLATGERLPAKDIGGRAWPDGAARLTQVGAPAGAE